jgi:hypothetical protein
VNDSIIPADVTIFGAASYFRGTAGKRFSVRVAGSRMMPTDSSAVTPSRGSLPSGRRSHGPP